MLTQAEINQVLDEVSAEAPLNLENEVAIRSCQMAIEIVRIAMLQKMVGNALKLIENKERDLGLIKAKGAMAGLYSFDDQDESTRH